MKKLLLLITVILALFLSVPAVYIKASSDAESNQRIYDNAGLLSTSEYEELEKMCMEYGEDAGIEIFILTHNDPDSVYPEAYIENFEDTLPIGDRVHFLYDVYRNEIFIEGYGLAETYIHSKRIDQIFDEMVDDLRAGEYYDAFETYITMSASYMKDDSELNEDHNYSYETPPDRDYDYETDAYDYDRYYDDPRTTEAEDILENLWFQLAAALVIGAVTVGIMAYHSGGKMTVHGNDYLERSRSGLIGRRDNYIRTRITRVRRPQQSSSSGRGGFNAGGFRGGISGGGRSHSSGGRKL